MKEIKINVYGMHCNSCEILLQDALEEQKGVVNAKAFFADEAVIVNFDEKLISVDDIKKIIVEEGFGV